MAEHWLTGLWYVKPTSYITHVMCYVAPHIVTVQTTTSGDTQPDR